MKIDVNIILESLLINLSFIASVWLAIFQIVPWWTPVIWLGVAVGFGATIGVLKAVT